MNHKRMCCVGCGVQSALLVLSIYTVLPVDRIAAKPTDRVLGPSVLTISDDARTLFVACADAHQVLLIDLPSGEIRRQLDLPDEPTGLALTADGERLIVTCASPHSRIVVFAVASGEVLATMKAGHTAVAPVLSPDGSRLYVCNRFDDDVSIIEMSTGKELLRVSAVREPIAAAVTPNGRSLVIANHLPKMPANGLRLDPVAAEITVIDTETFETNVIELHNGASSLRGMCVSLDGRYAFVTHILSNFENVPFRLDMGWINVNVVSVIDIQQRRLIRTIGLDQLYLGASNPWGIACSQDGQTIAVSVAGTHELSIISTADLLSDTARRTMSPIPGAWPVYPSLGESLWHRVPLPGKGPRSLVTTGSKVFIALYFSDSVAVVDMQATDGQRINVIRLNKRTELTLKRKGELLFNDATICYQQWQSCASCHPDGRTDGMNWDLMNDGVGNPKNTKSMLYSHRTPPAMAVGVRESAELAVRSGLTHILFNRRPEKEAVAIDAYLKSLRPIPSPRRIDGELTQAAKRGEALFHSNAVGCHRCHEAPLFTDQKKHQITSSALSGSMPMLDTPTLVEVWRTAPYLHDGRFVTVRELLVEGKHGLGRRNAGTLNAQQIDDLVEFVLSL